MSAVNMDNIVEIQCEPPVRVENELCSRFRCTKSQCVACAAVCPVPRAVRLVEQGVEITDACIACDACASACPNGAIQPAESDWRLAERMRERVRPPAGFRIGCERAEGPADFVVPCLSRLTEAVLLEPIRCGAERVELLAPDCSGCQLERAAPQWGRVLNLARALCESAGFDADRIVRTDAPRGKRERTRIPLSAPGSRRAMFRAFAKWTAKTVAAAMPDVAPEQTAAEPFRDIVQRHPENPKRSHLLEVLQSLPGAEAQPTVVPAAGKPFAHLEVTPGCVGCNVCETLCPVGALRRRGENGTFALDFNPALCTGCRVCEVACFHRAVRVRETVDLSVLFERRSATLISATRRTCRACHETFLGDASEFCPSCLVSGDRRDAIARRFFLGGNRGDWS